MITDTLTNTMPLTYTVVSVPSGSYVTVQATMTYGDIITSGLLVFLIGCVVFALVYGASRKAIV
jgi:hypothetical protein